MALPHFTQLNLNQKGSLSPVYSNLFDCCLIGTQNLYTDIPDLSFKNDVISCSINIFENMIETIDISKFLKDIEVLYLKIHDRHEKVISNKLIDCYLVNSTLNFSWGENNLLSAYADFKMTNSINLDKDETISVKSIQRDLKIKSIL